MKHIEKYKVSCHDVDLNSIAKPSAVLRFFQETAYLQHEVYKPTIDELRAMRKAYILSRVDLKIYKKLKAYDEITVESWACDSRGASFLRCGRMFRGDELVAEIYSLWAVVDMDTKRLCRHSDIELGFGTDEPLLFDSNARVKIPPDLNLRIVGERTVYYGDVDNNRHMNNTNYPDMLVAFIPDNEKATVESITINYEHEAKLGETFKVLYGEDDGIQYLRTILPNGETGVNAKIITGEL